MFITQHSPEEWDASHLMIRDSDSLNWFTLIRSAIRACQHTIDSPGPWPGDAEEAQAPALPCKLPQINPVAFHDLRESGTVVVVTERPGLKEDFQRKCLTCYG